jgi:hypothetical protein
MTAPPAPPGPPDPLSPERIAALIAPTIDRLRMAMAKLGKAAGTDIAREHGLSDAGYMTMAMLRNAVPYRVVAQAGVHAIFSYLPPQAVETGIAEAIKTGLLVAPGDGKLQLTDTGRDFAVRMYTEVDKAVASAWSGQENLVRALLSLAGKAIDAAMATGGPAFNVLAPPNEPEGASDAMVLAERLTPLRFHRFDAHVAAWRAAGLTAAQMRDLSPGPERDAIEAETNRAAAVPYAALEPAERLELACGLGALPN